MDFNTYDPKLSRIYTTADILDLRGIFEGKNLIHDEGEYYLRMTKFIRNVGLADCFYLLDDFCPWEFNNVEHLKKNPRRTHVVYDTQGVPEFLRKLSDLLDHTVRRTHRAMKGRIIGPTIEENIDEISDVLLENNQDILIVTPLTSGLIDIVNYQSRTFGSNNYAAIRTGLSSKDLS